MGGGVEGIEEGTETAQRQGNNQIHSPPAPQYLFEALPCDRPNSLRYLCVFEMGLGWSRLGLVVAEKNQIHYPRTTNKSPYISNRDTTENLWVIPQHSSLLFAVVVAVVIATATTSDGTPVCAHLEQAVLRLVNYSDHLNRSEGVQSRNMANSR